MESAFVKSMEFFYSSQALLSDHSVVGVRVHAEKLKSTTAATSGWHRFFSSPSKLCVAVII